MKPKTTGAVVNGRPRQAFPGDHVYLMNRSHTDDGGIFYPAGTEYAPLSAGNWGQEITVNGKIARFSFER